MELDLFIYLELELGTLLHNLEPSEGNTGHTWTRSPLLS